MYTLRIDALNPAQLDGTTPLDLTTATRGSSDPNIQRLGLELVTIPVTDDFGLLNPGEVFGATQIPLRLVSATVLPGDGEDDFSSGDEIRLVGPNGTEERVVDLIRAKGISNLIDTVIPIGYGLAFDTTSGTSAGPHRIQLNFLQVQKPSNRVGTLAD